jgi:hypothetical protein
MDGFLLPNILPVGHHWVARSSVDVCKEKVRITMTITYLVNLRAAARDLTSDLRKEDAQVWFLLYLCCSCMQLFEIFAATTIEHTMPTVKVLKDFMEKQRR